MPTSSSKELKAAVSWHRADVLIIDPLNKTHLLEENSSPDMTAYMEGLNEIARKLQLRCSHGSSLSKGAGQSGAGNGHGPELQQALVGSARSIWGLAPQEPAGPASDRAGAPPRYVTLSCIRSITARPARPRCSRTAR